MCSASMACAGHLVYLFDSQAGDAVASPSRYRAGDGSHVRRLRHTHVPQPFETLHDETGDEPRVGGPPAGRDRTSMRRTVHGGATNASPAPGPGPPPPRTSPPRP